MKLSKAGRKKRIHLRVRKKVSGTTVRPRLLVYRSNKAIYCQIIDDVNGVTLAAANSGDSAITAGVNKCEQAKQVGKLVAERALAAKITTAVFDRGGYLYHGRVKSLAEGAREGGLNL